MCNHNSLFPIWCFCKFSHCNNRVCHQVALRACRNLFCTKLSKYFRSGLRFDLGGRTSEHKGCLQNLNLSVWIGLQTLCFKFGAVCFPPLKDSCSDSILDKFSVSLNHSPNIRLHFPKFALLFDSLFWMLPWQSPNYNERVLDDSPFRRLW